jgi:hypothetical protein
VGDYGSTGVLKNHSSSAEYPNKIKIGKLFVAKYVKQGLAIISSATMGK